MPVANKTWNVLPHGPIEKLAGNLWRVEGSLPNMPLKRVLTVVRMSDGRLLLHNGIALGEAEMGQLEAWGTPAYLVVPNGWHRLDAPAFKRRYPSLQVVAPAGARKAVGQALPVDLDYDAFPADPDVRLEHLAGVRDAEGVLHVRSDDGWTLVFNDVIFNLAHQPGLMGFVSRYLLGSTGGPKVTRVSRLAMIRDRSAFRAHLRRLAAIDGLQRIVMSHGRVIDKDAAAVLRGIADTL